MSRWRGLPPFWYWWPWFGRGRGWCRWLWAYLAGPMFHPHRLTVTEEREYLTYEKEILERELRAVEDRLRALETRK
jgi:hypothetical protein